MTNADAIIANARQVIETEAEAVTALLPRIDSHFIQAVEIILASSGRVAVTGIGKSGQICQKLAATMASTGTPAFFLHPTEGIHGDLGMLMRGDVVVAISNSGETEELLRILPVIKRMGLPLIALTGGLRSTLAKAADTVLDISVAKEACPLGLAPTASTTAALAMGDALAISLLIERGFKEEDFALYHPGGSLGKRLLLRTEDLMHSGDSIPLVAESTSIRDALFVITSKKLGITGVTDGRGELVGVYTDGDLRRTIEKGLNLLEDPIHTQMTRGAKRILRSNLAAKALQVMESSSVTSLFVFDDDASSIPCGIIHLHDLLKAGVV